MTRPAGPVGACALVVSLLALAACSPSGPSRADAVAAFAAPIVERYELLADSAVELELAVQDWCAGSRPAEALDAVGATRLAWLDASPFWFGPTSDRRSRFIIDPTRHEVDIDALIDTRDQPVDATSLRELAGADQRGLAALEYLLSSDATERRCEYGTGLTALVVEEAVAITDAWSDYTKQISADDEAANLALRNIVSGAVSTVQMAAAEDDPDRREARLEAARRALLGDGTFLALTELLSHETVQRLAAEFDAGEAMDIEITITTNVATDLGTTLNFSDADGDG